MLPLYGEYFGLITQPFSVSPDPRFLYASPSHKEALAELSYGIRARRGFVVLTGEVGTGKTTLIRSLLGELDDGHTRAAFISTMIGSFRELLRSICEDFDLVRAQEEPHETHDYLSLFNRFLSASYQKGDNVALVIDEAQNLSPEVLEGVRVLSNFESAEEKLLQILLVGQPELDARLNEPVLRQLKQRVALRCYLSPLGFAECREYIARRLEIAGGGASIISENAAEAVYIYSGGIPRLINILCDNGLFSAYSRNEKCVGGAMIEEIARSLRMSAAAPRIASPLAASKPALQPKPIVKPEEKSMGSAAVDPAPPLPVQENIEPAETAEHGGVRSAAKDQETNGVANGSAHGADTTKPSAREQRPFPKPALQPRSEASESPPAVAEEAAPPIPEAPAVPEPPALEEDDAPHIVPPRSFERMLTALTEAMGPMAPFVVGDHVSALGESQEDFPKRKFRMLVESTSGEILSESLKERYQTVMFDEVRAIGAFWEEP